MGREAMTAVAKTILEQMGGSRFVAMTGAKYLVGDQHSLRWKLARPVSKVTHVCVVLQPDDTYRMIMWQVGKGGDWSMRVIETFEHLHASDLQTTFTAFTGLETHL
jgi:hypothetical protein